MTVLHPILVYQPNVLKFNSNVLTVHFFYMKILSDPIILYIIKIDY